MHKTKMLDMRTYTYIVKQYSLYEHSDTYILIDRDNDTHVLTSDIFTHLWNMLRIYGMEWYDNAIIIANRIDELLHSWVISDSTCRFIGTVLSLVRDMRLFEVMPPRNDIVIPNTAGEFESSEIFILSRYTQSAVDDFAGEDFEPPSIDELMQLFQACA